MAATLPPDYLYGISLSKRKLETKMLEQKITRMSRDEFLDRMGMENGQELLRGASHHGCENETGVWIESYVHLPPNKTIIVVSSVCPRNVIPDVLPLLSYIGNDLLPPPTQLRPKELTVADAYERLGELSDIVQYLIDCLDTKSLPLNNQHLRNEMSPLRNQMSPQPPCDMGCRVVHCKKEPYDIYIGRPSKWGNPFTHKQNGKTLAKFVVGSRDEAIAAYREWITSGEGKHLIDDLHELKDKVLGCWCKPQPCHGDILSELVTKHCA